MGVHVNLSQLINLILPSEMSDYFEVKDIQEANNGIEFFLEELNVPPEGYRKEDLLSKGFFNSLSIQDFPLRGRSVFLNIKRRKWKDKTTNKIIHRYWNTVAQGTHLTQEFADFLKEILRQSSNK